MTLPFESETFDCVSSVGVLEHVRETGGNEVGSMREIHRVLVKGGLFICYHFPNRHSYIEKLNARIPSQHHHTYKYTRQDIEKFCDETGFDLLESRRYGFIPRNSWNRLPRFVRHSRFISKGVNSLDAILGSVFSRFCQNHYFVACKR
ncbi:methyltransferase domain-containing protein [Oscillatoria amoena NRMC-F 0135]|nr:methyltransferase domain-containing protein [Oscillatoria amoena NRMC-F 0135]